MAKKNLKLEEYSYCRITDKKFFIMRRVIGNTKIWDKVAETYFQSSAKCIVEALNKA